MFFFFKQKTAYEMRISDWSSDVCSSDLQLNEAGGKLWRQVVEIGMVLARNNKHMPRPYGVDIKKGHEVVVFMDDACGDFLIYDGAENTRCMRGFMPSLNVCCHGGEIGSAHV